MPWHVIESSSCPASKSWAVIKDADGTVEGCHPTKAAAQKQMAALYANEGTNTMSDQHDENGRDDLELRFAVAPITHIDVRDASDSHGFWTMSGYAAVFNQSTTLYDGKFLRLTESIAPQAFDAVLRDQPLGQPDGVVHFNLGHDMNRSVAATDVPAGQPGSLQLAADAHGLQFLAKVPSDDPDGVAMAAKMRSGVLRQASFAFTVSEAEYTTTEADDGPDTEHRTILAIKHLYDVCATPQGAYAQTTAGLRSLAAALGEPTGHPGHRQPHWGDGEASARQGDAEADEMAALEAAQQKFADSVRRWRVQIRPTLPERKTSDA